MSISATTPRPARVSERGLAHATRPVTTIMESTAPKIETRDVGARAASTNRCSSTCVPAAFVFPRLLSDRLLLRWPPMRRRSAAADAMCLRICATGRQRALRATAQTGHPPLLLFQLALQKVEAGSANAQTPAEMMGRNWAPATAAAGAHGTPSTRMHTLWHATAAATAAAEAAACHRRRRRRRRRRRLRRASLAQPSSFARPSFTWNLRPRVASMSCA